MEKSNNWVVERAGYLMKKKNIRLHDAIELAFEQYKQIFRRDFINKLKGAL